jgi:hypothetical protein
MLLTEEEARKKVCRQELVTIRDQYEAWHIYCIASDCAKWRKAKNEKGNSIMLQTSEEWTCEHCNGKGKDPKFIYKNPEQSECDNLDGFCYECDGQGHGFKYAPAGYCGLAGKPGGAS